MAVTMRKPAVVLITPIVAAENANVLAVIPNPIGAWPGLLLLACVAVWMLANGLRGEQTA